MTDTWKVAELRYYLTTAPRCSTIAIPEGGLDYNEAVRIAAGEIVRWAIKHKTQYYERGDSTISTQRGIYNSMKADNIPLGRLGLSGAQWDMAYDAAAICLGRNES